VWTRNQLQRACDAAAISGASQLPNTVNAQSVAITVAGQNNVPSPTIGWPSGTKRIQVTATRQVPFGFAKVIGLSSGTVSATATAGRFALKGVGYNVPLAITTSDYERFKAGTPFENELIDNNRQDFKDGTVTALDVRPNESGKSPDVFQRDLTYGFSGTVSVGDKINALAAALSSQGPNVMQAMTARFNLAAAAPYYDTGNNFVFPNYPAGDPRIVTLIVADPNPVNNNNPVLTVRKLVAVYIETVRDPANKNFFMKMRILPSKMYSAEDTGVVIGDDATEDTGLAVVRLIS
jgi:hypothetical protein